MSEDGWSLPPSWDLSRNYKGSGHVQEALGTNTPGSWPRHNRALRVSARSVTLAGRERVWGPSHLQGHLEKILHPGTCPEGLSEWTSTCVSVCMCAWGPHSRRKSAALRSGRQRPWTLGTKRLAQGHTGLCPHIEAAILMACSPTAESGLCPAPGYVSEVSP